MFNSNRSHTPPAQVSYSGLGDWSVFRQKYNGAAYPKTSTSPPPSPEPKDNQNGAAFKSPR
ncbi:MAG TPA: hypothetical protein VJK30_05455 [Coxiellaceae bacterium]|nr:MAG: hypothetical protein A3E81_01090 [Gammaproteobacteria bacterium RIFCSPHIGHO2_12_FULL_36_30]HLB56757.1 hypothetical protein [Coxiellaceae bacterium]